MSDKATYRLSLVLAVFGALLIAAQVSGRLLTARDTSNLPAFQKSSPSVPDWPSHQYLPIG